MSVTITIENAVKRYGDVTVIPNLSIAVREGELFTLLGPSGCGKTTLLRMIAGFNSIEGGTFRFNDKIINDMEPGKRDIGMVFQNYAIFPNLTVRKNVEFGLKHKKMSKAEMHSEADRFMKLVHVDDYADRMPDRLSGGQQQRVALARALVIKPDVLLMDEPLSNLDAKLRVEMRTVIKELQHQVGITTVYVTHDQEEAMAISDRIAVMQAGVIHHCGEPKNIYQRPADLFVATFIGKTNLLTGSIAIENGNAFIVFANGYREQIFSLRESEEFNRKVMVSVRPEEMIVHRADSLTKDNCLKGVITDSVFLGSNTHYFVKLETGEKVDIIQESEIDSIIRPGTEVKLTVKTKKINLFDPDSTLSLMEGVQNDILDQSRDRGQPK